MGKKSVTNFEENTTTIPFIGGDIILEKDVPKLRKVDITQTFESDIFVLEIVSYIKVNLEGTSNDNKD